MIWTDELPASLDQIDGVVVFHRVEQTRVQQLAQELASKVRLPELCNSGVFLLI
jgi:translation initiation factor 3 subunit C